MKKVLLSLLFLANVSFAQKMQIEVQVNNAKDGKVELVPYHEDEDERFTISEISGQKGLYHIQGEVKQTILARLVYKEGEDYYASKIFAEPGKIAITIDIKGYKDTGYADIVTLSGTPNNEVFFASKERIADYYANYDNTSTLELNNDIKEIESSGNIDKAQLQKLKDKLRKIGFDYHRKPLEIKLDLYEKTKGSLAAFYLLTAQGITLNSGISSIEEIQDVLAKAGKEARKSPYYSELKEYLVRRMLTQPGYTAPLFELMNIKGEEFSLRNLKGKYVLLDFWAYYCKPCIASFPKMKEMYNTYKDFGFEIVSISTDLDQKKWRNAFEKYKNPWVQVIDRDSEVGKDLLLVSDQLYNVSAIPTYYFINNQGKIMANGFDEDKIFEKIIETMSLVKEKYMVETNE